MRRFTHISGLLPDHLRVRLDEFNEDQPRDEHGRFGSGGGSSPKKEKTDRSKATKATTRVGKRAEKYASRAEKYASRAENARSQDQADYAAADAGNMVEDIQSLIDYANSPTEKKEARGLLKIARAARTRAERAASKFRPKASYR